MVDIGWQDKYIWERDPDKLDFDSRVSGHTFESHSQYRTDGCGLAIWTAANEQFDFSDDFKCPGYSRATAHAAAAVMPKQQLKSLGRALVTVCRHNGARPIRVKDGCGLGCYSDAWFLMEDIARLNKRHFGGYDWMLNKSIEAAIMEIVHVVMYVTQHGKGRLQIGIEVY